MTIPEPADGCRVVVDTGSNPDRLELYWRDDAAAAHRSPLDGERWFDSEDGDPMAWVRVVRNFAGVFLVDNEPWKPLIQPDDPDRVAVRLFVEEVIRDVVFDRDEYEQAKTDDELDHLIDIHVSDMDGDSYVVEADGTMISPY
jgi:hypothetical protein